MPKIVRLNQFGGPEVLKFVEEASRQPGKGEVRLRVKAAGLNRAESMFFRGQYIEEPKLPSGLGYEAAGVGEAVCPAVDKSGLGNTVGRLPRFWMSGYTMRGREVISPAAVVWDDAAKTT